MFGGAGGLAAARVRDPLRRAGLDLETPSVKWALLLLLVASPASAQNVGTAFSGAEIADGASAYINPAAMGAGRGTHLELDLGLAVLGISYERDASTRSSSGALGPYGTIGGFTDLAHPDVRIGLALAITRTTGASWSRDEGAADVTRYYMVSGQIAHVGLIPAMSWSPVEWLTIGLGVHIAYANMASELDKDFGSQLNQTAGSDTIDSPFPYAHPDLAAPVSVSGDGVGGGVLGGVHIRPIPELAFGLSLHSPVWVPATGTLSVVYPQRLLDFVEDAAPGTELPQLSGTFRSDLDIPLQLFCGMTGRPHPQVELSTGYRYENMSSQPELNLRILAATNEAITDNTKVQGQEDRHAVMLRAAFLPVPELRLALFASFTSNTVPEDYAAPNNIDFDRFEIGLAAQWRIVREVSVMAQYSHIFLPDRNIEQNLHRPIAEPSLAAFNHPSPTGTYAANADTVRIGVALHL
jgi:long-subunit fatty acid transport protein